MTGDSKTQDAAVIRSTASEIDGVARIAPWPYPSTTKIMEIDVGDPSRMRLLRTLELDGSYVAARLVGSAVRGVVSAQWAQEVAREWDDAENDPRTIMTTPLLMEIVAERV